MVVACREKQKQKAMNIQLLKYVLILYLKKNGRIQQLSFFARQNNPSHTAKYIYQPQIKNAKTDATCNGVGKI
jgi:hypothetical protein